MPFNREASKNAPFEAANLVDIISFTVGADAGTTVNVALVFKNPNGEVIAQRGAVEAYLSDDANGDSIAASAPSGGVAIGTNGLAIPVVTSKAWLLTSESNGLLDLTITEAGAATWYLIVRLPNGKLTASGAIVFT